MRERRKGLSVHRTLGSLLFAALLSGSLLYGIDYFYRNAMERGSALTGSFYIVAIIAALAVFVLLLFPANRPLKGIKNLLRWLLIIVAVVTVFGSGILWDLQGRMMYYPRPEDAGQTAKNQQIPGLERLTVTDKSGTQYGGWLWKNTPGKAGLILYFGGNAEYAASSVASVAKRKGADQAFRGYNYLMMDYPGYGNSQGEPGEESIYRMALATWDAVVAREDVDPDRIVIAAWSLGTGTATRLAAEKQPAGLVLMAPFYNGATLVNGFANKMLKGTPGAILGDEPFGPNDLLVRNRYRSDLYARQTPVHTLIVAASEDSMIPSHQAEKLAQEYASNQFVMVEGSHFEPYYGEQAFTAIVAYLQGIGGGTPALPEAPATAVSPAPVSAAPQPVTTAAP